MNKKRFNIVDIFIAIVLVGLMAGVVYRFTAEATAIGQTDHIINYTVRIEGVRAFTLENYHPGLRVYNRMTNEFIGHIINVRYEQHYQNAQAVDGEFLRLPFPDHIVIYIDIEANGRVTDNAIFAEGNNEINAGSSLQMNTRYVHVNAIIHSVSVVGD